VIDTGTGGLHDPTRQGKYLGEIAAVWRIESSIKESVRFDNQMLKASALNLGISRELLLPRNISWTPDLDCVL
jgi:hypothetical protein